MRGMGWKVIITGNIQVRILQSVIKQIMELRTGEHGLWDDMSVGGDVDGPAAHPLAVEICKEVGPSLPKRKRGNHDQEEERSKQYRTRARQRASMDAKK